MELKSGKNFEVKPPRTPGGKWANVYVKAPAGEFKIIARDESTRGWFAFKAPREMGRFSFWAMEMIAIGKYILAAGFASALLALCVYLARLRPAPRPQAI